MIALSLMHSLHYKGQLSTAELRSTAEHYKNPTVIDQKGGIVSSLINCLSLSLSLSL